MASASDEISFAIRVAVPVRFKDLDVGGHAHHSHALVYFEEARTAYWAEVSGTRGLEGVNYIVGDVHVRYHARVLWPQTLEVSVRTSRLGKRHFELTYEVRGGDGDLLLSGETVQVMYDYPTGSTTRIPDGVRAAIDRLDGPFGPGGLPAAAAER